MPRSKYANNLGERLFEIIKNAGRPLNARELSILTKESPRAIGRAMGNMIANGKMRIACLEKSTRLALYDIGRDNSRVQSDEEPEGPYIVEEIAKGHYKVRFGASYKPGKGQNVSANPGSVQSSMNPGSGW